MCVLACRLFLLGLLGLALAGCDSGAPVLASVHGRVSYNGILLHTGTIVFTPDPLRGTVGSLAHGEIQADGSYVLYTGDQPGVAEGWHRVTIVALEHPAQAPAGTQRLVPRSLLPDKYRDPGLSGLVCEVKGGNDNRIDFNLD
jgi:hypothetical protein